MIQHSPLRTVRVAGFPVQGIDRPYDGRLSYPLLHILIRRTTCRTHDHSCLSRYLFDRLVRPAHLLLYTGFTQARQRFMLVCMVSDLASHIICLLHRIRICRNAIAYNKKCSDRIILFKGCQDTRCIDRWSVIISQSDHFLVLVNFSCQNAFFIKHAQVVGNCFPARHHFAILR